MDCKSVGERIKARKQAIKLTVEELSHKSGIPEDTINNIIYGRTTDPRIESLAKIAQALDTTLDYIVFGKDPSADALHNNQNHHVDVEQYVQSIKETHAHEIASIRESHAQHVLDMKETHAREVTAVRDHANEIRLARNFWRALSCGLAMAILVILAWFV